METAAMPRLALIAVFVLSAGGLAACQTDAAPQPSRDRPPGAPERQLARIIAVEVRRESPMAVSVTV